MQPHVNVGTAIVEIFQLDHVAAGESFIANLGRDERPETDAVWSRKQFSALTESDFDSAMASTFVAVQLG